MRTLVLLTAASLTGCTSVQLPADNGARLDPIAFFSGRSHGEGVLRQVFASPRALRVRSEGRLIERGGLQLTQRIVQDGKAPRTRSWVIRPDGSDHYTGTLTEAVGPVILTIDGPRADVRYRMKGGLAVHQQLALQRDGRTILNHLEVRKWGIRVARVDETIRKLD